MSSLRSLFALFLSPVGLVVLGALDSSIVFFLPFGVDGVLVAMVAHHRHMIWTYPVLTTVGSLVGAAVTYCIGHRLGDDGLRRFADTRRLEGVRRRAHDSAAFSTALLALIPPPFPFTAFVLASGALAVSKRRFFTSLAAARLVRFGVETLLARRFGERITLWVQSPWVERIVVGFIVMALAGTILSVVRFIRSGRSR
jgi:membrane protein YqaA with SNARE-associated domain